MRWKTVLKEPLLHFLLIGAALFLFFQWKDVGPSIGKQRIVVAADRVAVLAAAYEKAWGRPPTDADVQGLVEDGASVFSRRLTATTTATLDLHG